MPSDRQTAQRGSDPLDAMADAEASGAGFNTLADSVMPGVRDMRRLVTLVLRSSEAGNRRREPREPLSLRFTAAAGGFPASGHTVDLSLHGALLGVPGNAAMTGRSVPVEIERVGPLTCHVRGVSHMGVHTEFTGMTAPQMARVGEVIEAAREENTVFIARCQETAAEVAGVFGRALAAGDIAEQQLFSLDYTGIQDTDPQQYLSPSTVLCDRMLPPIIGRVKDADAHVVFCAAVDASGYLATHNLEYSKPQRRFETVWNTANSRNRRIYEDRAGAMAASNMLPYIVQTYPRDMGGGVVVMLKEFDAPITVRGRHWGGLRLAVKA